MRLTAGVVPLYGAVGLLGVFELVGDHLGCVWDVGPLFFSRECRCVLVRQSDDEYSHLTICEMRALMCFHEGNKVMMSHDKYCIIFP